MNATGHLARCSHRPPNPSGLCMCGCGEPTERVKNTNSAEGYKAGDFRRFRKSHHTRGVCKVRYEIDRATGCWMWQGYCTPNGYGFVRSCGVGQPAHRYAYEIHVGPIPEGMEIDHLCRNRACVNPDHLEVVTHQENMRRVVDARKAVTA